MLCSKHSHLLEKNNRNVPEGIRTVVILASAIAEKNNKKINK